MMTAPLTLSERIRELTEWVELHTRQAELLRLAEDVERLEGVFARCSETEAMLRAERDDARFAKGATTLGKVCEECKRKQLALNARPTYADLQFARAELQQAREEIVHWKANHADVVNRCRVLLQRPDLPVDRLPAIANCRAGSYCTRCDAPSRLW